MKKHSRNSSVVEQPTADRQVTGSNPVFCFLLFHHFVFDPESNGGNIVECTRCCQLFFFFFFFLFCCVLLSPFLLPVPSFSQEVLSSHIHWPPPALIQRARSFFLSLFLSFSPSKRNTSVHMFGCIVAGRLVRELFFFFFLGQVGRAACSGRNGTGREYHSSFHGSLNR